MDLPPIILANGKPIVLVIKAYSSFDDLKVDSIDKLVALAKAKPTKLKVTLVSPSSIPHLLIELTKSCEALDIFPFNGDTAKRFSVFVPPNFKGGPLRDVLFASSC